MIADWQRHDLRGADGTLALFERQARDAAAGTIFLLHGFTGSHSAWWQVAARLPRMRVLAPDLPGHGASRFADEEAACRFSEATARLIDALDRMATRRCIVAGYSMGGRLALHLALAHPERVESLVLESASPGLPTEAERAARRAADATLAEDVLRLGVEAFLERWQRAPVLAAQISLAPALQAAMRRERAGCRADGLAASLLGMGTGAQPWLGDRLAALRPPLTCIAGGGDAKFSAIARAMVARVPGARLAIIDGVGHNVHLERPSRVADLIAASYGRQTPIPRPRGGASPAPEERS